VGNNMIILKSELKKAGLNKNCTELKNIFFELGHEVDSYTRFENKQIVVGHVLTCERVAGSDKLNKTTVNVGNEILQIVCGAANVKADIYVLVALPGCELSPDFKIEKREVFGIESNGMICSLPELGFSKHLIPEIYANGIFILENFVGKIGDNGLAAINLDDRIFDLSITANRGDCQSYAGIIQDLAAKTPINHLKQSNSSNFLEKFSENASIIRDPDDAYFYINLMFDNIIIDHK